MFLKNRTELKMKGYGILSRSSENESVIYPYSVRSYFTIRQIKVALFAGCNIFLGWGQIQLFLKNRRVENEELRNIITFI